MRTFALTCLIPIFLASSVQAQDAPKKSDPNKVSYTDKQTGLEFPAEIGKLKFSATKDYGDPKLGVGIKYKIDESLIVDVIIYNLGIEKIPQDLEGTDLKQQVDHSVENIKTYSEKGFYRDLQLQAAKIVPLSPAEGSPKSHLVECAFTLADIPRESRPYVFPYKNHFVKVRATWALAEREVSEKEVDRLLAWLAETMGK